LLQPRVLGLKLPQPANVARLEAAEALAPGVDRLLADPVPLGHRRYWFAICLADDCNHLLFREPTLPHCSLRNREPVSQLIAGPKIRGQVRCETPKCGLMVGRPPWSSLALVSTCSADCRGSSAQCWAWCCRR